jgi:hypothetical protein
MKKNENGSKSNNLNVEVVFIFQLNNHEGHDCLSYFYEIKKVRKHQDHISYCKKIVGKKRAIHYSSSKKLLLGPESELCILKGMVFE